MVSDNILLLFYINYNEISKKTRNFFTEFGRTILKKQNFVEFVRYYSKHSL